MSSAKSALFAEIDDVDSPSTSQAKTTVDPRIDAILHPRPVPIRFQDATQFKHKPKKQHPLYETTSNGYGSERPNQSQFPQQWHGVQGEFTKNFTGGATKNNGFVVSISKSKVHKLLDD